MHWENIVHLDIKPENILVLNGDFYLTDFGLAKDLNCKQDMELIQEGDGRFCSKELLCDNFVDSCQN